MAKLKSKINRFFYQNRDKGVPNLMLFIAIGNAVVYLLYLLNQENDLFGSILSLDPALLLRGQVWRLFTHVFLFLRVSEPILGAIELFFLLWAGRVLEQYWGTLRFNTYYLMGVLLTDVAAVLLYLSIASVDLASAQMVSAVIMTPVSDVNLTILLALATVAPDERVYIWFILPIKLKWLAWVYFAIFAYDIIRGVLTTVSLLISSGVLLLTWLLPLVSLLNYFLFFGKGIMNVMPDFIRYRRRPTKSKPKPVFHTAAQKNYRFKCTVCGRTEVSNPELEFRYCSKCSGYRCYCQDHINNHAHITDITG